MSLDRWHIIDLDEVSDETPLTQLFPCSRFPVIKKLMKKGDPLANFPNYDPPSPTSSSEDETQQTCDTLSLALLDADREPPKLLALTLPGWEPTPSSCVNREEKLQTSCASNQARLPPRPDNSGEVTFVHKDAAGEYWQKPAREVTFSDVCDMYNSLGIKDPPSTSSSSGLRRRGRDQIETGAPLKRRRRRHDTDAVGPS
jgi:hypothetical protein